MYEIFSKIKCKFCRHKLIIKRKLGDDRFYCPKCGFTKRVNNGNKNKFR